MNNSNFNVPKSEKWRVKLNVTKMLLLVLLNKQIVYFKVGESLLICLFTMLMWMFNSDIVKEHVTSNGVEVTDMIKVSHPEAFSQSFKLNE